MRLLLVLLALLSGLSLAEVTATSARAEVVGSASILSSSQERKASISLPKARRPVCERHLVRTVMIPVVALGRTISIVICDRPLE